eukprot:COSAG01_NODE_3609_length_5876_cov_70.248572_5_plen_51_part_00
MAIGGGVSVAAVRHMHSTAVYGCTVERETDQLKNADAEARVTGEATRGGR